MGEEPKLEDVIKDITPEEAKEEEKERIIEFLKKRVKENNGKLPPPSDTEFFSMVEFLRNNYGINLKKISDILNVNYDSLRAKMSMSKKVEAKEIEKEAKEEEAKREMPESLSTELVSIIMRKARAYFGKTIDRVTLTLIGEIVEYGLIFYTKFMPWCRVNGYTARQCIESGMNFFIQYRDVVESLEEKIREYREFIKFMHIICSEEMVKYATVEALSRTLSRLSERGLISYADIERLYDSINSFIRNKILGG